MEGSEVPRRLRLRGVEVVVGFALFLGGFSSEDKAKDFGLAALFLSAGDFLLLSVVSVRLSPIFELSNFACSDVNTGGGENSHLSSLRNVSWPENQGILFFYISQTFQMNWISFMASHINAVL